MQVNEIVRDERDSATPFWTALSADDKRSYAALRAEFRDRKHTSTPDTPLVFRCEIQSVMQFIGHSPIGRQDRSIVVGLAISGGIVAVNTRQLKTFIGRCKSSINGGFQQLGFDAVKTRLKAREWIIAILPSLELDQSSLRQWTVRVGRADRPLPPVPGADEISARPFISEDASVWTGIPGRQEVAGVFNSPRRMRASPAVSDLDFRWSDDDTLF
jgi:hypothetical protein